MRNTPHTLHIYVCYMQSVREQLVQLCDIHYQTNFAIKYIDNTDVQNQHLSNLHEFVLYLIY